MSHPYPTMQAALKRTNGDRSAARHLIKAHIMADAERLAAQAGRSIKCKNENHADEPYGCKNDGTGCICFCHDAASPAYAYQKDAG